LIVIQYSVLVVTSGYTEVLWYKGKVYWCKGKHVQSDEVIYL